MRKDKIENMIKGWFVGNFSPAVYSTKNVEVAVKHYKSGEGEKNHYHKIATEITVVIEGIIAMNQVQYHSGEIIIIEPGESVEFISLTDAITTVVKIPGEINDKYFSFEGSK